MSQFTDVFLQFIDSWGYYAVAILMGLENACIPIPSELILGFAGYMIFAGRMTFTMALVAGMVGGILGSAFAYALWRTSLCGQIRQILLCQKIPCGYCPELV